MSHEQDRETIKWATAAGTHTLVKDLKVGHLVNIINWVQDNRHIYGADIRDVMIAEARYRQVLLFAEGKPYPQNAGTHWVLIDPQSGRSMIERPPKDYLEAVSDNEAYQQMAKATYRKRKARQQ
jgi:hypothetical protein